VVATAVLAVLLAALAFAHFREKPPEMRVVRSTIEPPENTGFGFDVEPRGVPALSPDGRRLVFGAQSHDGTSRLWLRSLDSAAEQALARTEGATYSYPFWSPDSRYIGFSVDGKLKKIDLSGGPASTLADAPQLRGASWSPEGVIVFAPNFLGPLQRMSAAGGTVTPATALDPARKETSHRWPWFLPDGRHFLYDSGTPTSPAKPTLWRRPIRTPFTREAICYSCVTTP
jgi:Tol biopolymer transport system component